MAAPTHLNGLAKMKGETAFDVVCQLYKMEPDDFCLKLKDLIVSKKSKKNKKGKQIIRFMIDLSEILEVPIVPTHIPIRNLKKTSD